MYWDGQRWGPEPGALAETPRPRPARRLRGRLVGFSILALAAALVVPFAAGGGGGGSAAPDLGLAGRGPRVVVRSVAGNARLVRLIGSGFEPWSVLQARWDSSPSRLRLIWVNARGGFNAGVRMPKGASDGAHTVSLSRVSRSIMSASFVSSRELVSSLTLLKVKVNKGKGRSATAPEPSPTPSTAPPDPAQAPDPTPVPDPTAAPDPTSAPDPTTAPDPTAAPEPTPTPAGCGSSLQARIDATPAGGKLDVTGCSYTGAVKISRSLTILGGTLKVTSGNGVSINTANVTIEGLAVSGLGNSGSSATGIRAYRSDGLTIRHVTVSDWRYAGIMVLETAGGLIEDSRILRIGMNVTGAGNAYGIAISNQGGVQSSDITVQRNIVDGVPNWHGLDTHAGIRIKFLDNVIHRTNRAIFVTGDSYGRSASTVQVSRNRADDPTPRDDVRNTYPWNEVGITVINGSTSVRGDGNVLDGWPAGSAISTYSTGAVFAGTTIANPVARP